MSQAAQTWVKELEITHFRNLSQVTLSTVPGQVLLLGLNGQGKTNLLEALAYLSTARSVRASNERHLIQHGESWAKITICVHTDGQHPCTLEARLFLEGNRLKAKFWKNGVLCRSRSDILGSLPTVSFFLSDLELARGTPAHRRQWLDQAIAQLNPAHYLWLTKFQRIRQQKGTLLKEIREAGGRPSHDNIEQLHAWNSQLATVAAEVLTRRLTFMQEISPLATSAYHKLSGDQEQLETCYVPYGLFKPSDPAPEGWPENFEQAYHTMLGQRLQDELTRGMCLIGPHRDDVELKLNQQDLGVFGSQGQQRSVVLSLKRAEYQQLCAKKHRTPVILLDDVMAELDLKRQNFLLESTQDAAQLWLTTTHLTEGAEEIPRPQTPRQIFSVSKGNAFVTSLHQASTFV
jgi:DNA replication and repair protein RecF